MGFQYNPGLKIEETRPYEEHSVMGRGQQICDMGRALFIALEVPEKEKRKRAGHDQGSKWDHRYREEAFEREWP